jgi:hypothetical protein
MQVEALKIPVLLVVNVTVPVGVTAPEPEASVTVTVQVLVVLSGIVAGEQFIVMLDSLVVDETAACPELLTCVESPP